jgi:uncharacterized protein (DUF4415 family)
MRKKIDITQKPTNEQIEMLKKAENIPVSENDDYPEFSEEELRQFKKISESRKESRQKQTVTLRLSPRTLKKAKSLGKGYTSVLSRILENALDDPDIVKRNL